MITVILKGYPRLSETFIAQELHKLEQHGLKLHLVSLRHPTDKHTHPVHDQIKAPVLYLPEYLYQEIPRVFKAWRKARQLKTYKTAFSTWLRDLLRDPTPNRIRRFGQACVLAMEMPTGTTHLYAHFLHTPASVTRYASIMSGIPWSCSAHAKDIWTSPAWELREKLNDLSWLTTCTAANHDYLSSLAESPEHIHLVYHGLDLERFSAAAESHVYTADGSSKEHTVQLVSVGRAVAKKGYADLLTALARMPAELNWHLTHIGGGPLLSQLKQQAQQLGIAANISWLGTLPQQKVLEQYRNSDLFVLTSKIVDDGDRDGLPNVLMEAQSQGLCCLASDVSGIPELIIHNQTGVLVESGNVDDIARSLQRLLTSPGLRQSLGQAGLKRVHDEFNVDLGIHKLVELLPG